jgi:hypothetical protein
LTYLGFITEGKIAAIFIKPSLGVSNWPVIYFINYTPTSFLALFNTAPSLHSIASTTSSNQHRESFPYELDKIHPKMLQQDGMVMMVMKVLVAMVMMMVIPMKPGSMTVMIPPSGKEFPWQISACRRAFSLCVFSAPQRRWSLSAILLPILGFWGDDIHEGAMVEVGQGGHTTRRRGLGLARATRRCGPLVAHFALSFWLLLSSGEIEIFGYFPRFAGLKKYCILMVLFLAES